MKTSYRTLLLWFALCASLTAPLAQEEEQPKKPRYLAAASIYSLEQVTVVYPAGGDVDTNRFSAERRAAFLQRLHGIDSEVASDDAITEEQLAGNLLLLGWNNRLLQLKGIANPIKAGPPRQFLDIVLRPGREVIFAADSPFNPESRLTFWSRIDPELDRFSVIPFTGSDWAILADDAVFLAGMFELLTDEPWPPTRNTEAEIDHRQAGRGARPRPAAESAHYTIYDWSRSFADVEIEAVLAARERAYEQAVARLGAPDDDFRIELHLYRDEKEKREQTGVSDPMHAIPRKRELHMVHARAISDSPHEDAHVVAHALYGSTLSTALYEGLAICTEPAGQGAERAMNAAAMARSAYVPDLASLLDEEDFRAATRQGSGFPSAMQLAGWLRETTDEATFKSIYAMKRPSATRLAELLGKSREEAQQAFGEWLAELAVQGEAPLTYRAGIDTGRKRAAGGDHAGAVEAWQQALEAQPDDLRALHGLALAHLNLQQFRPAEQALTRLLAATERPGNARFRSFALYQMGRLNDLRDKRKAALRYYRSALELDDYNGAHELARAAIEEPETIQGVPGYGAGRGED